MRRFRLLALPLLLLGCGGGGTGDTSFFQGSVGTASVTFTPGADYNGMPAALNVLTALDGSASSNTVTITATNNNRAVEAVLIAKKAKLGTVVDLDGTTGSNVLYTDPAGRWFSSSGTITVQARTGTTVTLLLTNVLLTSPSEGTSLAKGSVTLNGTLSVTAS